MPRESTEFGYRKYGKREGGAVMRSMNLEKLFTNLLLFFLRFYYHEQGKYETEGLCSAPKCTLVYCISNCINHS